MPKPSLKLLVALPILTLPGFAQLLTNPVQDYVNRTNLLNNILSNARATGMSQKAQTESSTSPASRPTTPAPDPTGFTPSPEPLLPKLLAGNPTVAPAARQQAERAFASALDLYQRTARKDGFPANDLAFAFQYFVVNSYLTYHDLHDVEYSKDPRVKRGKDSFDRITIISQKKLLQVTPAQERAVYEQLKRSLSSNPVVRAMTDQRKQELTEVLAILFGMNLQAYLNGVNSENDGLADQARQTARAHLEKLTGATIDRIKIGNDGLQF